VTAVAEVATAAVAVAAAVAATVVVATEVGAMAAAEVGVLPANPVRYIHRGLTCHGQPRVHAGQHRQFLGLQNSVGHA
jgi:hypothetical protein